MINRKFQSGREREILTSVLDGDGRSLHLFGRFLAGFSSTNYVVVREAETESYIEASSGVNGADVSCNDDSDDGNDADEDICGEEE